MKAPEIVAALIVLAWACYVLARWLELRAHVAKEDGVPMVRGKFKVASVTQTGNTATVLLEHAGGDDDDADVHGGSATVVVDVGAGQGMFAPGREVEVEITQAD